MLWPKGSPSQDIQLRFFSQISFPDAPESPNVAILIDYENSRRINVNHWCHCQRHRRLMRKVRMRKLFHILLRCYWVAVYTHLIIFD